MTVASFLVFLQERMRSAKYSANLATYNCLVKREYTEEVPIHLKQTLTLGELA
ncbi:hypothetical protein [Microcoleus sp. FACHB-672]|uniref:hypothetical protein n=1 Tax=Microcoleus sp. FACHB-672 TaxID=2692825 RepID=UPI0016879ABD|nr:hypothetical protein [Microcoleus sp. FACHB-672]MBD2039141.1 hypothetical protein [Microcoleus sp. FACHB-672]